MTLEIMYVTTSERACEYSEDLLVKASCVDVRSSSGEELRMAQIVYMSPSEGLPYCIYRANNDYNIVNKIVTIIIIIIIMTITTAIRIGIRNKNKIKNKDIRFCLFSH